MLVCYRAGKESKVLVKILLSGYETNFLDRDGRYSNIIRIARPGSEHWFYADSKDAAEKWIMVRFKVFVCCKVFVLQLPVKYSYYSSLLEFKHSSGLTIFFGVIY